MDKIVEYQCKSCHKLIDVGVTIYAHDEYFCDTECYECGAKIPDYDQYKILNDEVVDWFSSMVDNAHELYKDKQLKQSS